MIQSTMCILRSYFHQAVGDMDGYKMVGWCITMVCIYSSILGCWSQDGCAYEADDVRFGRYTPLCPQLKIDNGSVCYKRHVFYLAAVFTCNEGYYLYGSTNIRCHEGFRYWSGRKPECFTIESTTRNRTARTIFYNTTPAKTISTKETTAEAQLTTISTTKTSTPMSLTSLVQKHVQLITNTFELGSTTIETTTQLYGSTDNADNTKDIAWSAILSAVVAALICVGILIVCYRKMKRVGTLKTTSDHQGTRTTYQTNAATYTAKGQIVVLPLCDIKTTTVLHDTRIYPTENKWLPGQNEAPTPHTSLTTIDQEGHGEGQEEDEDEEGTLTNAGYEDDDYIHSIFQRLHDGAKEDNNSDPDPGVKSEESTEYKYNKLNSKDYNQHKLDYSQVNMKHNPLDDHTYHHLYGSERRCSGEATYSHLYDSWLDRHQRTGDSAHVHNVLPTDTISTIDDNEMDENSDLY